MPFLNAGGICRRFSLPISISTITEAVMELINNIVGTPLGYLMRFCYQIFSDYGVAVILFTLLTKVIMFPISLMVQKNSIKMVKMKPQLDALRYQHIDDKDAFFDAQNALYKQEKYSPVAGIWPLLLQLPIIFGLLDVVYKPLKHLLHVPGEIITQLVDKAASLLGTTVEALGSTAQLKVVEMMSDPAYADALGAVAGADHAHAITSLNMEFLGINLAYTPSLSAINLLLLVPVFAGLTALLMCWIQNRINVLQIEQSKLSQWGMTIFMVAFSSYFAFLVPTGVGMYWGWGNLFAIVVMYLVNLIYDPKKYIDYKALEAMKKQVAADRIVTKRNKKLAKKYYKQFCKTENLEKMKLMFYAEGSGYYKYFADIIDAILKNSKLTIHYVTSDPEDAIFQKDEPRIIPYYVDETRLISLMMKVEADMVVMTTPDLEKYHIKRSKVRKDVEYVYVDHGCTSLNLTYRTGALDHFDTIFTVSPAQSEEVRALEVLRNTKKKKIVECGYGLIDNMIAAYQALEKTENEKKTILIAPSWQYDNIMDSCLDDLVEGLYGKGYRIVIRPHPQYVRRFPMQIQEILERYKDRFNEDFAIETDFSSNVTVYTADLLITDWSAIAYEFSFTTDKPTLFINTQMKVVNKAYKKLKIKPFDITARSQIGKALEKDEVVNIAEAVAELLENGKDYAERISTLKHEYFYNLGHSGEVGAEYIIKRLTKKKKKKKVQPAEASEAPAAETPVAEEAPAAAEAPAVDTPAQTE